MSGLAPGLAVAAIWAGLVVSLPAYKRFLRWRDRRRVRRADSVDAAWRENRVGLDLDALPQRDVSAACEAILAATNGRGLASAEDR